MNLNHKAQSLAEYAIVFSKETITPQGESKTELLEPTVSLTQPFTDDFSDKKLTEEGLF